MRANLYLLGALLAIGMLLTLGGASVAYANGGIEPGQNLLTAWNSNPLPSLGLFLAAYLYLNGLSRWDRPSHPVNRWQRISFFGGLIVIFLALQSPIDTLAEHHFSIHQAQHLLLRMIGPLLVLGGAPLTPLLRGLPLWALQGAVRPVVGSRWGHKYYDLFTNPVLTTIVFLAMLYFWQVPRPHNLAVSNDVVHALMHSSMLLSGFLFWWLVVDPKPHRSRLHYGLRVLYLGLIVIPNTVLGASITFNGGLIYQAYYDHHQPLGLSPYVGLIYQAFDDHQPLGLSPLIDQQLGGLLLWVVGDMMSILAAGIVMAMWWQQEEAKEKLDAASR